MKGKLQLPLTQLTRKRGGSAHRAPKKAQHPSSQGRPLNFVQSKAASAFYLCLSLLGLEDYFFFVGGGEVLDLQTPLPPMCRRGQGPEAHMKLYLT